MRILTGDTPTGRLHLGHYVGSLENRLALQRDHEVFVLIANVHALTTRADKPAEIRRDTLDIVRDYLAVGLDPERVTFVVQSAIPAIAELTVLLAMLLPFQRVMRNPTLKDELVAKGLADRHSFGFPLSTVGQCADILAFGGELVPVGEDQLAHVEMCREVARRFNQLYGETFPIPDALVGRVGRLPGIDGRKMSKSFGNAILLSDDAAAIRSKVARITTGRQSITEPGDPENILFQYARAFMTDAERVRELADRYTRGDSIGDGEIKAEVTAAIDALLAPMRERQYDDAAIEQLLRDHARRANAIADATLARAKAALSVSPV